MESEISDLPADHDLISHHPGETDRDDREQHGGSQIEILQALGGLETGNDRTNLQSDEDEREDVEDEDDGLLYGV